MSNYTLSHSKFVQGWRSFYSYYPDMMIGMNSHLYSFKGGNLYKHNEDTQRNTFYQHWWNQVDNVLPPNNSPNAFTPSRVKSVFNVEPFTIKNFKTFYMETDHPWDLTVTTDTATGFVNKDWFQNKENLYFAFIRRYESDDSIRLRSCQGVGTVTTVNSTVPTAVTLTFTFNLGSIISIGDIAYKNNSGVIVKLGKITNVVNNVMTVDTTVTGGSVPSNGNFILYLKNATAESYGARGYYMNFELTNGDKDRVELFGVGSSLFKSYP